MAAIFDTICACIFQTVIISGITVSQPIGPGGSESEPAASAALAAAVFAMLRERSAGVRLLVSLEAGILLTKSRIVSASFDTMTSFRDVVVNSCFAKFRPPLREVSRLIANSEKYFFVKLPPCVTEAFSLNQDQSASVNKLALPPAAVVLMVSVRSLANFNR